MDDEKHASAMKQLRDTLRPHLTVTYPRVRDESGQQHWSSTSCELHRSQLQDGNFFLHEHVPRDYHLGKDLIHDLQKDEKVWHVRIDPGPVETDSIAGPGRCVCVWREIG